MSLDAPQQNALEDDADILQNMVNDFSDKWGVETTIGLLKGEIKDQNKKRVMPEKVITIKK